MKILVLGGTLFLGRHLVQRALAAGHEVTIFTRGRTNNDLFPTVSRLIGDRADDLKSLSSGSWDVVFDLSGYKPREVRASGELLQSRTARYVFVSTISVYNDFTVCGITEEGETAIGYEGYGALKARCEEEIIDLYGESAVVVRPGLIVGTYDPTFRFNYWLNRIARGGDILVPGRPERSVQIIDARDLADFLLSIAGNAAVAQKYNATGAVDFISMEKLCTTVQKVAEEKGAEAVARRLHWVDDQLLLQRDIAEWTELPLWLAENGDFRGHNFIDSSAAQAAGLTYRPLAETVADIYDHDKLLLAGGGAPAAGDGTDPRLLPTMSASLEEAILADLELL